MVTAFLAAISMASVAPMSQAGGFPDVPRDHWAYAAVTRLKSLGVLVGNALVLRFTHRA